MARGSGENRAEGPALAGRATYLFGRLTRARSVIRAGKLVGLPAATAIQLRPRGDRVSAQAGKALFAQHAGA